KFNTGVARHLFCSRCGIKSFYVPRSIPDGYSVNVRCLDPATIQQVEVEPFDDNEREASEAKIRGLSKDPGLALAAGSPERQPRRRYALSCFSSAPGTSTFRRRYRD